MKKSLKTRFFILLSSFFLIIISILSYSLLKSFINGMQNEAYLQNEEALNQLTQYLDYYLDDVNKLTYIPYYHTDIINILKDAPVETALDRLSKRRELENFLNTLFLLPRKDILQVYIISDDVYYSSNPEIPRLSYTEQISSDWYRAVMENQDLTVLYPGADGVKSSPHFSVLNVIRDINNHDTILGVIKVDATFDTLKTVCNSINLGKNGGISIVAEDGSTVYSTAQNIETSRNLISSRDLIHFGWKIYAINSLDNLHQLSSKALSTTISISVLVIVFSVLILLYVISSAFKPLNQIIGIMKEIRAGNRELRYIDARTDEIGYLGKSLNEMLDELNSMMAKSLELKQQIYEAAIAQQDIELRLLYGEIRPHFIYNTLNSITILIECGKSDIAIQLIDSFSKLLRGIAYINRTIFLNDEFDMVENYLKIHEIRFDYDLSYDLRLDDKCREIVIPALILQPIVENAILHGRNNTDAKMHISVNADICDEKVILTVKDNGVGIEERDLLRINQQLSMLNITSYLYDQSEKRDTHNGLGLSNILMRLRLYYKDNCNLYVDSQPNAGTTVTIEIPAIYELTEGREKDAEDYNC